MKIVVLVSLVVVLEGYDVKDFVALDRCDKIIDKEVFEICYSNKRKGALAVWYELKGELVSKRNIKKRPKFYTEKNIKSKYRAKPKDYKKTGFDRGHLASDASFDYDEKKQRKAYSMANVVPQYPRVNRVKWLKVERYERLVAVKMKKVKVVNIVDYSEDKGTIGKNKISIPTAFIKILFNDDEKYIKCFRYENNKEKEIKKDKLKNHEIGCEEIIIKT